MSIASQFNNVDCFSLQSADNSWNICNYYSGINQNMNQKSKNY